MNTEKDRFEQWLSSRGIAANYRGDGQYGSGSQIAWEAWQERAQQDAEVDPIFSIETGRVFSIDLKNAHTLADFVNRSDPESGPIDALHECIDRLAEYAPQWQPIETAPKDGTPLLLFARAGGATASIDMFGWHLQGRGWIAQSICGQAIVDIVPSHWMARPGFPKGQA